MGGGVEKSVVYNRVGNGSWVMGQMGRMGQKIRFLRRVERVMGRAQEMGDPL